MKVGKIPVASIVLLVIAIISYVMRHYYPAEYITNSSFIDGAFFGAALVYLLYYINIWITAYANSKKQVPDDSTAV